MTFTFRMVLNLNKVCMCVHVHAHAYVFTIKGKEATFKLQSRVVSMTLKYKYGWSRFLITSYTAEGCIIGSHLSVMNDIYIWIF